MKDWNWRSELYLWYATLRAQLFGNPKWYYKARGLTDLKIHILRERAKMTKSLWMSIMRRDHWQCKIHKHPYCVFKASQVDHVLPLALYGKTELNNLQAACAPCNHWKGIKIL